MRVIGRTANAIKIKTDGVLRAVNCACCGGNPCGIKIPKNMRSFLNGVTSATVWGQEGGRVGNPSGLWEFYWDFVDFYPYPQPDAHRRFTLEYDGRFVTGGGWYEVPESGYGDDYAYPYLTKNIPQCLPYGMQVAEGTFTINGTQFLYYYASVNSRGITYPAPAPPNLVLT
tara:strand:- start:107 stop:619 length:513 start_codon:yes stop_codon:yes gene_type:complete